MTHCSILNLSIVTVFSHILICGAFNESRLNKITELENTLTHSEVQQQAKYSEA